MVTFTEMSDEKYFRSIIDSELAKLDLGGKPDSLYEPIRYMINIGGKRLRPVLMMMCNEMFGGKPSDVMSPALGIEVFHNFTLLHDDIMDKAPLRRSKETVHIKWNPNIAILSGDAMFVQSCQLMMNVGEKYITDIMQMFLRTAIEVCEGQQLDMDFESAANVSVDDYIGMISKKTAALIACSAYIGAKCAGAEKESESMYDFGRNLGLAFQLHDDILDVYGESDKFGKQTGGDILSNKKTFLLLSAYGLAKGDLKKDLVKWVNATSFEPEEKITSVIAIYDELAIRDKSISKMMEFFDIAMNDLNQLKIPEANKSALMNLIDRLMVREK